MVHLTPAVVARVSAGAVSQCLSSPVGTLQLRTPQPQTQAQQETPSSLDKPDNVPTSVRLLTDAVPPGGYPHLKLLPCGADLNEIPNGWLQPDDRLGMDVWSVLCSSAEYNGRTGPWRSWGELSSSSLAEYGDAVDIIGR